MTAIDVTCELVDELDLDTRYLAGRLEAAEAEAFEAHYFGCERCWGLVQQGLAVRSTFREEAAPAAAVPRPATRWWGLAAAAAIVAVALGVWRAGSFSQTHLPEDVMRGGVAAFAVTSGSDGSRLTAAWPKLAHADGYRVRLYSPDGTVVLEREMSDTVVSVPRDSLAGRSPGSGMFWQVQALDHLRNAVAQSDLTPAVLPDP